jgi:hypothetical protein
LPYFSSLLEREAAKMVSLLVTAIGYRLMHAHDAADAYRRLARVGFLSTRALLNRQAVVSLIEEADANYPADQPIGNEPWRHVDAALEHARYLSWIGLTLGRRYVHRGWGGWV